MNTAELKSRPPFSKPLPKLLTACRIAAGELFYAQYGKGRIVEDRRDDEACVVLVGSGQVEVFSVSLDGNEVLLSVLSQGDMFGICNLFEQDELRTVLQCKTDCELLFIPKTALKAAILEFPEAMSEYAGLCNRKIQFLIRRIEQLSLNSARAKLAGYLLSQSAEAALALPGTKESLSLMLGISRAALYRELACLQEVGAILNEGSRIIVINREILENFLQQ